jgi:(heptosyl)LPS beta-1,4-glucosyltransferase
MTEPIVRKTAEPTVTLGVVAICYNEEEDLPRFIEHLLPWVDEIVVVDDGSTDRTAEIAAAHGGKVNFVDSPRGTGEYFSHQRNKGIDAAASQWLLHMDVDERVPPEMAAEVLAAIRSGARDAYRYQRKNHFLHRHMRGGGWQDWNQIHLARRETLRFGGMFHEDCLVSAPEDRVGQLHSAIYHLNEDNFAKRLSKSDRYLEELVATLRDRGEQPGGTSLITKPLLEFVKKYIYKRGYRDGIPGLIFALHAATARFRAGAILWDEQNRISRQSLEQSLEAQWQDERND